MPPAKTTQLCVIHDYILLKYESIALIMLMLIRFLFSAPSWDRKHRSANLMSQEGSESMRYPKSKYRRSDVIFCGLFKAEEYFRL